jgi:RHS repeat-associated protein
VTYAGPTTTDYTYDDGNRLTQIVDSIAGTITRTYDDLDRLISETTPQGSVSYTYDNAGRRATMTASGQSTVNYTYDDANRLTQITQDTAIVTVAYDDAGRRTSLTLPNGIVVQYGYDKASRLTELKYMNGEVELGNLLYLYDKNGNRNKVGGTFARTDLPQAIASSTYNNANRQTALGGKSMVFDKNGNLTSVTQSGATTTYTWNPRNQLTAISGSGVSASFVYDGLGRREKKTINGSLTEFLYDGLNPVQETAGANVLANTLSGLGIDQFFSRIDVPAGNTSYMLGDGLGSILALTDSAGAIQTEYTYEPFGKVSTNGLSDSNSFQYTSRENDGTGLFYYRARYYDPQLHRFVAEDPIGFGGGLNNYAYVGDAPMNYRDSLGMCRISARFRQIGGLGGVDWYHAYILTSDRYGTTYYGAFPEGEGPSSGEFFAAIGGSSSHLSGRSCSSQSSAKSRAGWGVLVPNYGAYTPSVADGDYTTGKPPELVILDDGSLCDSYDTELSQAMDLITNQKIPYDPFYNNSNAAAATALRNTGLPVGPAPVLAPGWSNFVLR